MALLVVSSPAPPKQKIYAWPTAASACLATPHTPPLPDCLPPNASLHAARPQAALPLSSQQEETDDGHPGVGLVIVMHAALSALVHTFMLQPSPPSAGRPSQSAGRASFRPSYVPIYLSIYNSFPPPCSLPASWPGQWGRRQSPCACQCQHQPARDEGHAPERRHRRHALVTRQRCDTTRSHMQDIQPPFVSPGATPDGASSEALCCLLLPHHARTAPPRSTRCRPRRTPPPPGGWHCLLA